MKSWDRDTAKIMFFLHSWIPRFSGKVLTILTSLPTSTAWAHKKNLPVHPWQKTCVWKRSPKKTLHPTPNAGNSQDVILLLLEFCWKTTARGVKLKNSDTIPCSKNMEPIYSIPLHLFSKIIESRTIRLFVSLVFLVGAPTQFNSFELGWCFPAIEGFPVSLVLLVWFSFLLANR